MVEKVSTLGEFSTAWCRVEGGIVVLLRRASGLRTAMSLWNSSSSLSTFEGKRQDLERLQVVLDCCTRILTYCSLLAHKIEFVVSVMFGTLSVVC